jgi:inhibitor of cysteine peptidase
MVQKEINKKLPFYSLAAILLAVLLVASIYSFNIESLTPNQGPLNNPNLNNNNNNPNPIDNININPQVYSMMTFSSYSALADFLKTSTGSSSLGSYDGRFGLSSQAPSAVPSQAESGLGGTNTKDYSTTNIQVAGVDEADKVKTDGNYIYMIGNNTVYILDANPQNAKVLYKIPYENTYLSGIYLNENTNKLVVLGNQYVPYVYPNGRELQPGFSTDLYPYWNSGTTFVHIYDVTDKSQPVLARNFTMTGNYVNSRMIEGYVYSIVNQNAYLVNDTPVLPMMNSGTKMSEIAATNIYYTNFTDTFYSYTTFLAFNLQNNDQKPTNMTIMMGGAGTIYVSQSNIYVTYPTYNYQLLKVPETIGGATTGSAPIGILPQETWQEKTSIYRIAISGPKMTFAAQGNVTGNVLNQYAMDENNNYFRIATTAYYYNSQTYTSTQQNNIYVLDMNLQTVGKLENLGTGENFHAARFMGNRCYLVTFQRTDPLFVIDLSQPNHPKLLGELIIPGYSDYLHPFDETHLIGLGKDAVAAEGNFAWYLGLKLSIFDVADVNNPKEIAKFNIGDRGTSSEALYEPKAFLFDSAKGLLVLPVDLYLINQTATSIITGVPEKTLPPVPTTSSSISTTQPGGIGTGSSSPSTYGQFVWQGVYIFKVSLTNGFELRGNVTQMDNAAALMNDPALITRSSYQWVDYNHFITRSLYIENVLYTFSETRVQLNSLDNFEQIARIDLN